MTIFKNGFLLSKYVNQNYRGNWCVGSSETVIAVRNGLKFCFRNEKSDVNTTNITDRSFLKFSPSEIPDGETVWVCECDSYEWKRKIWRKPRVKIENYLTRFYVVPFLIANTPIEAEKLKDWHK